MSALTTIRGRTEGLKKEPKSRGGFDAIEFSTDDDLVSFATKLSEEHERTSDHESRRRIGQVFTPPAVCRFMAASLGAISENYKLLDAGAGTGSLTAAVCERVARLKSPKHISATLFENDKTVLPHLERCMVNCRQFMRTAGHEFEFTIRTEDFVRSRSQSSLFDDGRRDQFDGVVMNPPYFKIAKDSAHARIMSDIVHGQPNIYALFMAIGAEMLRHGGSFVAITPRSYCNGLYFREFRRWFIKTMSLTQLHLFNSRTDTFAESKVLQESLITIAKRQQPAPSCASTIFISQSSGRDLNEIKGRDYSTGTIVDDTAGDAVIRIPAQPTDAAIIDVVESWPATFKQRGLCISTGPVVTFRATRYLLAEASDHCAVPLISVHNVRMFETVWPLPRGKKPIAFRDCLESQRLLLPSRNYVLLRRFSAKEENRRLTASCFIPSSHDRDRSVAIENHLNYVYYDGRELTATEVFGLVAIFNSKLLDRYFRVISGNTQVNATEIRSMPFPDLKVIIQIGERVQKMEGFAQTGVERIVLDELKIDGEVSRELLGAAS